MKWRREVVYASSSLRMDGEAGKEGVPCGRQLLIEGGDREYQEDGILLLSSP